MKKAAGKGRSRRPAGRSPVIAVRVDAPLYEKILASAKQSQRTMSEEMAWLLQFSFEMQAAFGTAKEAYGRFKRLNEDTLQSEMRRYGWRPRVGTPYWFKTEETGGFIAEPPDELKSAG